jgi:hypothetical protein
MQHAFLSLALVLAGAALGWSAFFSFVAAPIAFRDLDKGRADRYLRNIIESGHLAPASLSALAALAAFAGGGPGAAGLLLIAAVLFVVARFAVSPGARRRASTRILASGLTALLMPLTATGALLVAFGL